MIKTRWHRVIEAVRAGHVVFPTAAGDYTNASDLPEFNPRALEEMLGFMNNAARYFIAPELLTVMERPDCVESVMALHDAGIMRLPFPVVLVEFDLGPVRHFTLLWETSTERREQHPFFAVPISLYSYPDKGDYLLLTPFTIFVSEPFRERDQVMVRYAGAAAGYLDADYLERALQATRDRLLEEETDAVTRGLFSSLLLLNTRGVVKEVIDPGERLNRRRVARNRPMIPKHTIIRVGHVYDRSNQQHLFYDSSGRAKQRLHWRPGYTATRWTGPRTGPQVPKLVYVEPYLVNYDPIVGDRPPMPEREVRW